MFLHFLLKDGSQAKNKRKRGPAPKKKKATDQAPTTAASSPSAKKKKDSQEKVPRQASKRKAESTAHFSPANVLNSVIPTTTKKSSEEIPPVAATPSKCRKTVDLTKDFLSHIAKCVLKDEIQKLLKERF